MQKYEKMKSRGEEIGDSFFFSIISVVVAYWLAMLAIAAAIVFPPTPPSPKKTDDIGERIAAARKAQDIPKLRELLREKSTQETSSDSRKDEAVLSRMHAVHMNSLILLYAPAMLYTWSTQRFAYDMLYEGSSLFGPASAVLERFGPDMLTYAVCLFAIALHIFLARVSFRLNSPMSWVEEMAGPDSEAFPPIASMSSAGRADSPADCLHEDGGRLAIYSQNDATTLVEINETTFLGPSYRVVSCKCAADPSLKTASEWCEFCRCLTCGGQHAQQKNDEGISRRSERYRKLIHILPQGAKSLTLSGVLVVCLVGVAFFNVQYSYYHLYRVLYTTAAVAGLHLCVMLGDYLKLVV